MVISTGCPRNLSSARLRTSPFARSMSWKFPRFSTTPFASTVPMRRPSGAFVSPGAAAPLAPLCRIRASRAFPVEASALIGDAFPELPVTSVNALPMTPSFAARLAASAALAPVYMSAHLPLIFADVAGSRASRSPPPARAPAFRSRQRSQETRSCLGPCSRRAESAAACARPGTGTRARRRRKSRHVASAPRGSSKGRAARGWSREARVPASRTG